MRVSNKKLQKRAKNKGKGIIYPLQISGALLLDLRHKAEKTHRSMACVMREAMEHGLRDLEKRRRIMDFIAENHGPTWHNAD